MNKSLQESGVAEIVGSLMLIAIICLGIGIAALFLLYNSVPEKIPEFRASLANTSTSLTLHHDGGDSIPKSNLKILVNGIPTDYVSSGDPSPDWSIDDTLTFSTYDPSTPLPDVKIVYNGSAGERVLADFGSTIPSTVRTYTAVPTTSPTTIPVPCIPDASFMYFPSNPDTSTLIIFYDTSSCNPTSWSWSSNDGWTVTGTKQPAHTFTTAGTYTVTLTSSNAYGTSTPFTLPITITPPVPPTPPVVNITANITTGCAPLNVQFNGTSTGGTPDTWSWTFGDGGTSTSQNPSYTYLFPGFYPVKLTATNGGGSDTATQYITVGPPVTNFTANPTTGCLPMTVQFTDTSTRSPTSWYWDFGDGTSSTAQNPMKTYNTAGTYSVLLSAANTCGSNMFMRTNYITVGQLPVANFTATPPSGYVPLTVQFTDQSTGNPTSWSWDFGDTGASSLQSPSHTYVAPGTYNVNLTVNNACNTNSILKQVVVSPFILRVNTGDGAYTDTQGNLWLPDQQYTPGGWGWVAYRNTYSTSHAISNTADPTLYQTETWFSTADGEYRFTVPNGNYLVTLKFAEIYDGINPSNPRIFSLNIEGTQVLNNLYLYANPGPYIAYDPQFSVVVNDGILNIQFLRGQENPKISAIQIVSIGQPVTTYPITASAGAGGMITPPGTTTVNAGASQTYSITPNAGYHIAEVLIEGNSVGNVSTYQFTNVVASHIISVTFSVNPPVVTGIFPTSGPTTGATSVAITGTGFTGVTGVNFGTTPASSYTFNSDTSIIAISPGGTGTVDITVTTQAGTSATSLNDQYTYVAVPITAIGVITGTPQVGSILTAGALTPSGATATYQWQRSATSGGTYTNITGATTTTYTPVASDGGYYIKVVATGTGNYTGTITSAYTGPVTIIPVIQMFTSSGTSTVPQGAIYVDYLIVGGGGGGGRYGGGGGAGGFRTGTLSVGSTTSYAVTIGGGGNGATSAAVGANGGPSMFSTITSAGGGGGGSNSGTLSIRTGAAGGSGGGGVRSGTSGGAGNTPSVSPSQGNAGGSGNSNGNNYLGGGGGGAGANGNSATTTIAGNGGTGTVSSLSGSLVTYAGGGGGGCQQSYTSGTGGAGGGGNGGGGTAGVNAQANTGGGGGGGGRSGNTNYAGGNGGSGIVILRYY